MFVHSPKYKKAVEAIAAEDGELLLAVAFWGRDAEALLAGREGQPTRAICNLKSGATNPETVEKLLGIEGLELRQHDTLHAKAIASERTGLVGSANFSANGLNLEGEELMGWDEAGLLTTDPSEVESIRGWLEQLWKKAKSISDEDIEAAKAFWEKRRQSRVVQNSTNPGGFSLCDWSGQDLEDRAVYLVAWRGDVPPEAREAFTNHKEELSRNPGSDHTALDRLSYYYGWPQLPPDAQLIDFYYGPRGGLECSGVWRRVYEIPIEGDEELLIICTKEDDVLGRPFGSRERKTLTALLKPHMEEIWERRESDYAMFLPLAVVRNIVCPTKTPRSRS